MRAAILAGLLLAASLVSPQAQTNYNGVPVTPSYDQMQAVNGKAWSDSTGAVSIAANKVLDVVFLNSASSGCNAVFTLRRYSNYSTSQLGYTTYNNPGTLSGPTTVSVGTGQAGASAQSGLSLTYVVENAGLMTGTAGVTDGILATYKDEITIPYNVPPGKNFGLEITGLTATLSGAVSVSVTLAGYCQ